MLATNHDICAISDCWIDQSPLETRTIPTIANGANGQTVN